MTAGIVFGAMIGLGAWVLGRALRPATPALAPQLARLAEPIATPSAARRVSLERLALDVTKRLGLDLALHRQDLAITDRQASGLAVAKLGGATAGVAIPVLLWVALGLGDVWVNPVFALGAACLGACIGWFVPTLSLRAEARARRAEFVAALALYLDLVAVSLAGGNGAQTALRHAASVGDTWAFRRVRGALTRADLGNRSPWDELGELADEIGVDDLAELTSSMQLAGTTGARVRATLVAKASSTRQRQLATVEQEANEASERMSVPLVLMMCGFVVFVGYPALVAVFEI